MKPEQFLEMASRYTTLQKIEQELGRMGTAFNVEKTPNVRYGNQDLSPETVSFLKGSIRSLIDDGLRDVSEQKGKIEKVFSAVKDHDSVAETVFQFCPQVESRGFSIKH